MINYKCRKCGEYLEAPNSLVGQSETCPTCGNVCVVPGPSMPVASPPRPPMAVQQVQATPVQYVQTPAQPQIQITMGKPPKATSGLGVAALVLGIIACLTCWIPFIGLVSIPVAVLGLLFGGLGFLISLLGRRSGVGMPFAGCLVCVVSIFVAMSITHGAVSGIDKAMKDAEKETNRTNQQPVADPRHKAADAGTGGVTPVNQQPVADPVGNLPSGPADAGTSGGAAPAKDTWAPAGSPVRQGDMQIRVASVKTGKVAIRDAMGGENSNSKDALLSITVELTNLSETKKLDYTTWGGGNFAVERDFATLKDNFDNSYKRINFGMDPPVGRIKSDSIYPGKSLTDVLVFELPVAKVTDLYLELPAQNFGGTGMIRLQIPASMIQR